MKKRKRRNMIENEEARTMNSVPVYTDKRQDAGEYREKVRRHTNVPGFKSISRRGKSRDRNKAGHHGTEPRRIINKDMMESGLRAR